MPSRENLNTLGGQHGPPDPTLTSETNASQPHRSMERSIARSSPNREYLQPMSPILHRHYTNVIVCFRYHSDHNTSPFISP